MRTSISIGLFLLGALSCAHSAQRIDPARSGDLILHAQGAFVQTKVSANGMQGPRFNLARTGTAIRGRVDGADVNLSTSPGRVSGMMGTSPFNLTVTERPNGLQGEGLIAGQLSDFLFGPVALQGRVGVCNYDLRSVNGVTYTGFRQCEGSGVEQATLAVPATLEAWPPAERLAGLGWVLAPPSTGLGMHRPSPLAR